MKVLYDECMEALRDNKCSECNDCYQCSVCDYFQQRYTQGIADATEDFYLGLKAIFEKYANDDWNKSTTATWGQGYESAIDVLEDYYDNLKAEQLQEKNNG